MSTCYTCSTDKDDACPVCGAHPVYIKPEIVISRFDTNADGSAITIKYSIEFNGSFNVSFTDSFSVVESNVYSALYTAICCTIEKFCVMSPLSVLTTDWEYCVSQNALYFSFEQKGIEYKAKVNNIGDLKQTYVQIVYDIMDVLDKIYAKPVHTFNYVYE